MSPKLGVLVVHGMGSQEAGYAEPMIGELKQRIGQNASLAAWEAVHWAPLLRDREVKLWKDLSESNKLNFSPLREFLISAFGDAAAYLKRGRLSAKDMYALIHDEVHNSLTVLEAQLESPKLLVVIAHSLGSIIMSDFIWDKQHSDGLSGTAFTRMESLPCFVTFGSNIAITSLAHNPVESIKFPPSTLKDHVPNGASAHALLDAAKWLNLFDPDDILGYPLKPLSDSYDEAVAEDREINVGGFFPELESVESHEILDRQRLHDPSC